ncbi:MAG TPA: nucleotidyltransferase family protein [Blastocatellia bacterium]
MATVLEGAWRNDVAPLDLCEKSLVLIASLLRGSGAAGLGWWRIRNTGLSHLPSALQLRDLYYFQALEARLQEDQIKEAFALLRLAGIEPILIKGWAAARHYPNKGLRPSGDIDLYIPADRYERATALLKEQGHRAPALDLSHEDLAGLTSERIKAIYDRSQMISLDGTRVRVMGAEDHLWFLSVHLLRHGAYRPLWLCDVAAALESMPESFDWDYIFRLGRKQADRVACTMGLAHQLLGARIDDTPIAKRARNLPRWLVPAVLKQWETPCTNDHQPPESIKESLGHPARIPRALRARWPDPIQATIKMNGLLNDLPRLPYQIGEFAMLNLSFIKRLPGLLRKR